MELIKKFKNTEKFEKEISKEEYEKIKEDDIKNNIKYPYPIFIKGDEIIALKN